ncbi:MAG: hypothetical protein H6667_16795 [Ardenticatenaceae bacterium]|nr:hypothetical protein [Ardenticatenaceae bacterium]MCB9443109.1 hypothetical protein [Ardenticatenaceae bacterium]
MYTNKQFIGRRRLFLTWLTLAMIVMSACSLINRGPTLGSDIELPPQTQAIMSCNETCSGYGQCGADAAGNQYVLGGLAGPLVENHDRLFPAGTAVTILSSNLQTIQSVSDNSQSQLRFYYVQLPDGRPDGWVAGWCVAAQ